MPFAESSFAAALLALLSAQKVSPALPKAFSFASLASLSARVSASCCFGPRLTEALAADLVISCPRTILSAAANTIASGTSLNLGFAFSSPAIMFNRVL